MWNNCEPAVVLEFYCLFFRTSWGVGVLNSAIFNSFHNRVDFGTILVGHRNFGGGEERFEPPNTPLGTPLMQTDGSWDSTWCLKGLRLCIKHESALKLVTSFSHRVSQSLWRLFVQTWHNCEELFWYMLIYLFITVQKRYHLLGSSNGWINDEQ